MANESYYRRGSLFWALLLIAIGGLFLWRNFNPEIHAWEIVGKYWPVLIIFWGLGKLVDYFALRGQPGHAVFLTGGEIFLLIFILLAGTLITKATQQGFWPHIQLDDEDWPFRIGDRFEFTDTLTRAAKSGAQIRISNEEGTVSVTGGAKDQILVTVRKTVYAQNQDLANQVAQQASVKIEEVPGGYELRGTRASSGQGRTARIDLELQVPTQSSVSITTSRGDVSVNSLNGNVQVTAERSQVELASLTGNAGINLKRGSVRATDIKGDCQLSGRGQEVELVNIDGEAAVQGEFFGPIKIANVSKLTRYNSSRTDLTAERLTGKLDMESGSLYVVGVAGPTTIITRNKDVTLEDFSSRIRIENNRGNIELRARALEGDIDVTNQSGGIELSLPRGTGFEINASARSGHIESEFTDPALRLNEDSRGATLEGTVGKRRALVRLSTTYGTIELREAELPPPPPAPPAPRAPARPTAPGRPTD